MTITPGQPIPPHCGPDTVELVELIGISASFTPPSNWRASYVRRPKPSTEMTTTSAPGSANSPPAHTP